MDAAGAIGVLAPFVGGTYYGRLVAGVQAAARAAGRRTIAIQTLDAAADLTVNGGNPAFEAPVAWDHIGGFIAFADAVDRDYLLALERAGKPVVLVGHSVAGLDRPSVLADNSAGMRAAVTHLIREHGCRRLAFTGYLAASDIRERFETYAEVLREHGLQPDVFLPAVNNVESGITWTARDFLRDGRPDALVAATDRNAIGAQRVLAESGLSCPGDYQLTGFDNVDQASFVRPELASIAQPLDAMSRLAVDLLLRGGAGIHRLPTRFVPRTSCGCTAFATRLPDLAVADPRERLLRRLAGVVPVGSDADALLAATLAADAFDAAASGDPTGVVTAADELYALLAAAPTQETLRVICRAVQEYAPADGPAARAVQDVVLFLGRSYHRVQLGDQLHLRSLISVNYTLGMALLHRRDADPRDASWLSMTPATAGSIALRAPSGELVRTEGWRRFPGATIPAGPTTVEAFPPAELVAAAEPGETVFVVRAKVGDSDRGWLALVDTVEHRVEDGRELVNQCASLLTVALDLRDQEAQLLRAAHSDRLTGLPNRSSFTASLEAAVGRPAALLFLDLDGFKLVNDTLGHHAGDRLLVCVAERLGQCLRAGDVAARFGGDEFLVLLDEVGPGPVLDDLVTRIRSAICTPYRLGDRTAQVGVSIGWADCATGTSAEQLLQDADTAMYRAKAFRPAA
ncbi:GGDEF domain-containing protein [Actinoplanes sp. NPDC051411]|uniref:GGDEF domain-containing protein n=1 Tax=Actinoplanes sp. NPDC051411 TaxID=3155522 RepID=UPI00342EE1E8